jgi:2-amino-4-hydroxy-6-hydroxymethyldihydropteridine diphosphokinase
MTQVYVSVGSNIDREANVRSGIAALRRYYGELCLSSVYESRSVGFEGDNFYNLVVGFQTDQEVDIVASSLRTIEAEHGRVRGGPRFSPRTLDLDLLLYDDLVQHAPGLDIPRDEITHNAFVLWPLVEIAPKACHPVLHQTYAELWQAFDKTKQSLWVIDFPWEG